MQLKIALAPSPNHRPSAAFGYRVLRMLLFAGFVFCWVGCEETVVATKEARQENPPSHNAPIGELQAEAPSQAEQSPTTPPGENSSSGYLSTIAQSVSKAYASAKASGQTAAGSARDWLMGEVASGNRWEYKIVSFDGADSDGVEKSLNELGRDGWQCFHVQPKDSKMTFYFQRRPFSITQSIPMSDLLKVIPYLGFGQGEQ